MAIPLPPLSFGFSPQTKGEAKGGNFGASSKFSGSMAVNTAAGGNVSATAKPEVGGGGPGNFLLWAGVAVGAYCLLHR